MSKSSRVAAAVAKTEGAGRKSTLPPLPSEIAAQVLSGELQGADDNDRAVAQQVIDQQTRMPDAPAHVSHVRAPEAPAAQTPAPAGSKNGSTSAGDAPARRSTRYSDLATIWVLRANPKRPGTAGYDRFALYRSGKMAAGEYKKLRAVGKFGAADISWDLTRGFIVLQEPGEPEPVAHVGRQPVLVADTGPVVAIAAASPPDDRGMVPDRDPEGDGPLGEDDDGVMEAHQAQMAA